LECLKDREELGSSALRIELDIKDKSYFRTGYLQPALNSNLIERTISDKPNSRFQKYRLTQKGIEFIKTLK
jgi:hypothetical protein